MLVAGETFCRDRHGHEVAVGEGLLPAGAVGPAALYSLSLGEYTQLLAWHVGLMSSTAYANPASLNFFLR